MNQKPEDEGRRTITVKKAHERCGLSPWQIKQRCLAGAIDSRVVGGLRLVYVDSLDAYIDNAPTGAA